MLTLEIVKRMNDAKKAHSEAARELFFTRKELSKKNVPEISKKMILSYLQENLSKATILVNKIENEYERAKDLGISSEVQAIMGSHLSMDSREIVKKAESLASLLDPNNQSEVAKLARSLLLKRKDANNAHPYDKSSDPDYEYDEEQDLYVKKGTKEKTNGS
jgi:hypothetical protein